MESIINVPRQNHRRIERSPKEVKATTVVKKIINEIKEVREDIKNLQHDESQFKKELASEIGESETILDEKGHVIATWSYNNTHRFNMDEFRKVYPELYEFFLTTTRERRLILKK
jgi:hypothetical protein